MAPKSKNYTPFPYTLLHVDTVGFTFDVLLPVEVVLLGGGIGPWFLGVDVDVMLDCCDAII